MIHHYTSLSTLSLILKNKKIRFNRLDLVDDTTETNGMPVFYQTCIFASCWTESSKESIPLWKMYGADMKSVRISFPVNMFQKKLVKAFTEENYGSTMDYIGQLSKEENFTDNYILTNLFDKPDSFFKPVIYEDGFSSNYPKIFKQNDKGITIEGKFELGVYKHTDWDFQEESRFLLYTNPLLPMDHYLVNGSKFQQMQLASYTLNNNIPNIIEYIDVDLDETVLNNIIVTIGPLCNVDDEISLSSLLTEFTDNGKINKSELYGKIRR